MPTVGLTGDSDDASEVFNSVVEHIHGIFLHHGDLAGYAHTALEIILILRRKASFLPIYATWTNRLLAKAPTGMKEETSALFLKLRAFATGENTSIDKDIVSVKIFEVDPDSLGGTVAAEHFTTGYLHFRRISENIKKCSERESGKEDGEAVYGGLCALRDILQLEIHTTEFSFLRTLADAMRKSKLVKTSNKTGDEPVRVWEAAFGVVRTAQDGWLRSVKLRETLQQLD